MSAEIRILSIDELHKLTRTPRNGALQCQHADNAQRADELWACLVETIRSPTVADKHMTAACNALCFVSRANAQSQDEQVSMKTFDQRTWKEMFTAARSAFGSGKNKPALQVLETLHYLTETNPERMLVVPNVEEAATGMVSIILGHNPRRSLKEACIVLYFFLRKLSDFMSFSEVLGRALNRERTGFVQSCHTAGISAVDLGQESHPQWFAFVLALLLAVRLTDSRSAVLKLLALLCGLPKSAYGVDVPSILSRSIDTYSVADETALEAVTRDVLPSILTDADLFTTFLSKQEKLGANSTSAILVVLALLQYGKSKSYVTELALPSILSGYWPGRGTTEVSDNLYGSFGCFLSHGAASIRIGACELLLSSTSPNTPFPSGVLACLIVYLRYLHDDTDSYHRGELFSIFRRFLRRVQQSYQTIENSEAGGACDDTLREYDRFYDQYLAFLGSELSASNSYPRHILALQVLHLASEGSVSQSGPLQKKIISSQQLLIGLFHLVLDPYDDVRALAAETIARIAHQNSQHFEFTVSKLEPLATLSRLAATTNRADHADALGRVLSLDTVEHFADQHTGLGIPGVGGLSHLCYKLESNLLHLSAFNVLDDFPTHGFILGIKYTIQRLHKDDIAPPVTLIQTLLGICSKIWTLSQCHLCIDSPEMESDPNENDDSGPKDRLAYAWRALRDSNLMMQAMLENFSCDLMLLDRIGNTCLNQLALLRHRGAFSTVAQTFVLCCQKARESKDVDSRNLVDGWFLEAMNELERQADKLTRRSAGLPAILAAVFDPTDKSKFSICFQLLVAKAEEAVTISDSIKSENNLRLPQVHALNCIKEIMTSSRFRVLTEPLVVFTLNLAASCMSSHIWAIKNCGLMLLRASINRLDPDTGLGASEAGMKQRALSKSDRRPIDVAVDFLSGSSDSPPPGQAVLEQSNDVTSRQSTEALFAGLDILSRLYIEATEVEDIRSLVAKQLQHPLWHIRAQAARLLAILTPYGMEIAILNKQLSADSSDVELYPNRVHGILMLTECLVHKLIATSSESNAIVEMIPLLHQMLVRGSVASDGTCMAYWLSVAKQILDNTTDVTEAVKSLLDAVRQVIDDHSFSPNEGDALYKRRLAAFELRCHTLCGVLYSPAVLQLQRCDDDTLAYTLTTFRPHSDADSVSRYLGILMSLLGDAKSQQRCSAVMQAFTLNVAQKSTQIDKLYLTRLLELIDFHNPVSRDLLNTQIVFYAAICRFVWARGDTEILNLIANLAGGFCLHLRNAANDEIEYDTRYSTIQVLHQWKTISAFRQMLGCILESRYKMDFFSVLYDLLNDDDEDIRNEASEFAAALADEADKRPAPTRSLCPAASRRQLRVYLSREFEDTQILRDECLRRVLGKRMTTSRSRLRHENERLLHHSSISSDLRSIFETMRELFIEEKQNLYIDEHAELQDWAMMLSKTSFVSDLAATESLAAWSIDGAQLLNAVFEGHHPWSSSLFDIQDDKESKATESNSTSSLRPRVMFGTSLTESLELLVARVVIGLKISGKIESTAFVLLRGNCTRLNVSQTVLSLFV